MMSEPNEDEAPEPLPEYWVDEQGRAHIVGESTAEQCFAIVHRLTMEKYGFTDPADMRLRKDVVVIRRGGEPADKAYPGAGG